MGTTVEKVSRSGLDWSDEAVTNAFVDQFEGATFFDAVQAASSGIDGLTESQKLLVFPELARHLNSEQLVGVAYGLSMARLTDPDASARLNDLLGATTDLDAVVASMMRYTVGHKSDVGNFINAVNTYASGPSSYRMSFPESMAEIAAGTREPFHNALEIFYPRTSSAVDRRRRYVEETLPQALGPHEMQATGIYRLTHAKPPLMAQPYINGYVGSHPNEMKPAYADDQAQVYNIVSDALDLPRHDNDIDLKLATNRANIVQSIVDRADGFPIRIQLRPTVYTPPNEFSVEGVFFDITGSRGSGLVTNGGGSYSGYADFAARLPHPDVDIVVAYGDGTRTDELGDVATVVHDARMHEPLIQKIRRLGELDQALAVGSAAVLAGVAAAGGEIPLVIGAAVKMAMRGTIGYAVGVFGYERGSDKVNGRSISPVKRPELWWDYVGTGVAGIGGVASFTKFGKPATQALSLANWGMLAATSGHIAMNLDEMSPQQSWRHAVIGSANAAAAVLGHVSERQFHAMARDSALKELQGSDLTDELIKPQLPESRRRNDYLVEEPTTARQRSSTPPVIVLVEGAETQHEFQLEGVPVPIGTRNRANAKFLQFVQFVWDLHFHKATTYSDAGGGPGPVGYHGYTDKPAEGSVPFIKLADTLGGKSSFVFHPIPQAMDKGCCPLQPYYLGHQVMASGDMTLQPMKVYLKSGGIVHIPRDYSVIGENGMLGVLRAGDYNAVDLGLGNTRMPEFPNVGMTEAYVNLIPNATMPLDGSTRMRNMIDSVAQLLRDRPDMQDRVSIGITSLSPRLPNGAQELRNVMAYAMQAHPDVKFSFMGLGETNFWQKEAVETLVTLSGESPHSMENVDDFLGFMNDNLPGSAVVIHQDAGRPIEIGLPGGKDVDRRLLMHGPIEYENPMGQNGDDRIIEIAKKYPNVNFVWAHGGGLSRSGQPGPNHTRMLERVLQEAPNVSIDMSWGEAADKIVRQNKDNRTWVGPRGTGIVNRHPERFIYGSDEVGQNLQSYTDPLRKYFSGGFFRNMVEPELFLRGNAEHLVSQGTQTFRNYMETPEVRQQLMQMELTGAWKISKIRQRLSTPTPTD